MTYIPVEQSIAGLLTSLLVSHICIIALTCVKMWSEVLPHQWAFPLYAMAYVCVACHTL